MRKSTLPRPTNSELEILRVLWTKGPSTVREVHEALEPDRGVGYTTVLKLLQIMTEKGLVRREATRGRSHVFVPCLSQDQTQRQLVRDLLERAFGGSAMKLVLHALGTKRTSAEERRQIRRLLDEMEGGSK